MGKTKTPRVTAEALENARTQAKRYSQPVDLSPLQHDRGLLASNVHLMLDLFSSEGAARDNQGADGKADTPKIRVPRNPEVLRLAHKIGRELRKGGTRIDIARDFAQGDEKKAQSLLRKCREFRLLD